MRAGPLVLVALMAGCSAADSGGTVCTAIFAYTSATAVDAQGQPVPGAFVVTDTIVRTGVALAVAQVGYPTAAGTVTIFSDSQVHDVAADGDVVHVTGTAGAKSFHAVYQFGTDGCHIMKIAGPDTVVAQ